MAARERALGGSTGGTSTGVRADREYLQPALADLRRTVSCAAGHAMDHEATFNTSKKVNLATLLAVERLVGAAAEEAFYGGAVDDGEVA